MTLRKYDIRPIKVVQYDICQSLHVYNHNWYRTIRSNLARCTQKLGQYVNFEVQNALCTVRHLSKRTRVQ